MYSTLQPSCADKQMLFSHQATTLQTDWTATLSRWISSGEQQSLSYTISLSANCSLLDNRIHVIPLLQPFISVCHLLSTACPELTLNPAGQVQFPFNKWGLLFSQENDKKFRKGLTIPKIQHWTDRLTNKLNLCLSNSISLRLWNDIWCIRLWNVCLSSAPKLQLSEPLLLLWLHKDLGQTCSYNYAKLLWQ